MRTIISPRLKKIANIASKIPGVKALLKPIYYPYKQKIANNRKQLFRENALKTLNEFDQVMQENNIPYSVFAGTLLGAVREKGFIKHDIDIDTLMFYSDYSTKHRNLFESKGFVLQHSFKIKDGLLGMEETYVKYGVTIDIFYIYSDEKHASYQCDFHPCKGCTSWVDSMNSKGYLCARRIEFPVKHKFVRVPFESIEVSIIENAHEWLCNRYGDDYMIPNPEFHDSNANPKMFEWEGVRAVYTKY